MEIKINGKVCACEPGEYLLQIAKRNGFDIPTLCYHPGLPEQGCCRLCIVEVIDRGWSTVVVSCVYPVNKEIEVYTESEKIVRERRMVLTLLQNRAPESREIAALCEKYGVKSSPRLARLDGEKCVLCGLCVKACAALGTGAISTVQRGTLKQVSTPYDEPSKDCIGCASCAAVCPAGAIEVADTADSREIWGRRFDLVHCSECGKVLGTTESVAYAAAQSEQEAETICPDCRRRHSADVFAKTYGI